ncbi:MAG: hypothetical protein ACREDK_01750 [Thermoplasmata archaeon]
MRARRASGGREGELLKRATRLRDSVEGLLPRLGPDCPTERFDRLKADLEKVRDLRDDARALGRVGRWSEPIVRAYAGLLRFYLEPDLPGIVVAPIPGGEVTFAPLGGAPTEAQVAVQHSDDPRKLLIGYLDWARKGFHFFATSETLYCTGREARPPEEFLVAQLAQLPYRLAPTSEGRFDCPHLARGEPIPFLAVGWPEAGRSFRVCRRCAKGDRQLLATLSTGLAVPDPEGTFPVSASLNVDCRAKDDCVHRHLPELPRGLRKRYHYGRLSDEELLEAYRDELAPRLRAGRSPRFVAAGICFGDDRETFLDHLAPSSEERHALTAVLPEVEGLFELDEASASRALERLWHDHADDLVRAIVDDPREAEKLVREAKASPGRVSDLLRRAARANRARAVLDALPRYRHLGPEAAFVDAVARSYRGQGEKVAERTLLQGLPREGKVRGLAYGLLLVLGFAKSHEWQFTETEQQFGRALEERARDLLTGPSTHYHDRLGALLGSAGVTDWGTLDND